MMMELPSVIVPTDCGLTVEQIAQKDVPTGKAYKIVNVSEISSDRTFRNAWTIDDAELGQMELVHDSNRWLLKI